VDLPTYTSIWRIEKRLYKLYDFRLPMPLPIGQVAVFVAIAVPYVVLLTLVGVPFNHTLIWLYILPPGATTWLVTRPVLEGKRLPELVKSQLRYLAEPPILCRMVPLAERDVVLVTGKVWRPRTARSRAAEAEWADYTQPAEASAETAAGRDSGTRAQARMPASWGPAPAPAAAPATRARAAPVAIWPSAPARAHGPGAPWPAGRPGAGQGVRPGDLAEMRLVASARRAVPQPPEPMTDVGAQGPEPSTPQASEPLAAQSSEPLAAQSSGPPAAPVQPPGLIPAAAAGRPRPVVTVVGAERARSAPPAVERALAGPSARRADLRSRPVSVVPGGHRPGKPDLLQRDRTRVQLPIGFNAKIIVLGCTVGAGQTTTALYVGEVLASLRPDRVAVLDLNPGSGSASRRAEARPALSQAALARSSRLEVIGAASEPDASGTGAAGAEEPAGPGGPEEPLTDPAAGAVRLEAAARQHDMVIADPATAVMPRLLAIADQLILVAPASAAAPSAIAMTFEWLDAHGQHDLAATSIMVLNGVSRRSITYVEQAERVCAGQCRAIVRVPWDDGLRKQAAEPPPPLTPGSQPRQRWAGILNPATGGAYTALAGVLAASLHDRSNGNEHSAQPAGRARR
jgi:MinD-like ATPase involved in chromosome partitioning or flagellar assembly